MGNHIKKCHLTDSFSEVEGGWFKVTNINHNIRLTAPEIGNLWTQYMSDSMATCILSHFLETCKDKDIHSILDLAIGFSRSHINQIEEFLKQENYPIFHGFTKEDVDLSAPPLFSDTFMLNYIYVMGLHGMNSYSLALGSSARNDQRTYFTNCQKETMDLYNKTADLMLHKGVFSRAPFINAPQKIDFVEGQGFLTGWLGNRRPLNALEISGIHYNMLKNNLKIILEVGFSQVAQSKEVRQYFQRGADICKKHNEVSSSVLSEDYLPSPKVLESEISSSTVPPFSDKLMLFQLLSLVGVTIGYYGAAISTFQRRDIITHYTRFIAEIGLYAEDGINLMIKNGWMEQMPTADDRNALAKQK